MKFQTDKVSKEKIFNKFLKNVKPKFIDKVQLFNNAHRKSKSYGNFPGAR